MTISNVQLKKPRVSKLALGLFIVAPLGFADAVFLSIQHFLNSTLPCSLVSGCDTVTTSQYSTIFGVPVALMGALYYLAIIIGVVYYIDTRSLRVLRATAGATVVGLLASIYFVFLQLFVLHAICLYCMFSAVSSTVLFILGMSVLKLHRSSPSSYAG